MPLVLLSDENIQQLFRELSMHFPKETGGVLMGYRQAENYFVTHLIGPGPKAEHELRSFKPDSEFHEKEIASVYYSSGMALTYLGDWHTHPGEGAYLSSLDKSTLKAIAEFRPARISKPIMLIVGSRPLEIRCWRYDRTVLRYTPFQLTHVCMLTQG